MVKKVRIFASSPGDVQSEREQLTKVINDLNSTISAIAPEKGISLELLKWETHTFPDLDSNGVQPVITRQIGEYDIFIGIMWKRFGTPTKMAGSGTEEEFRNAYSSWDKTRSPQIMFYFCQASLEFPNDDDLEQIKKVNAFRRELSEKGLIGVYTDHDKFTDIVRQDLNYRLAPIFSERKSTTETAEIVGQIALKNDETIKAQILSHAEEYMLLRGAMRAGYERSRKMEVIVTKMRSMAFVAYPFLKELTQSIPENEGRDGKAGERLAAVTILQVVPNPAYIDWLAERVSEERPFLGYHAAVALLTFARTLDKQQYYRKLCSAILSAIKSIEHLPNSIDRRRILEDARREFDCR